MALGSATELEYQLLLARDLHYLLDAEHDRLVQDTAEVKRMLTGLILNLKRKSAQSRA